MYMLFYVWALGSSFSLFLIVAIVVVVLIWGGASKTADS
ncbi:hypothetical protein SGODD07_00682 [Streptococcus gordonii]|uniref:Uncharacterized protein n=1 Tax=Streptococcus gordonii TaxID=1302 RepID=A0A139N9B2_STRGN|nr:hypothetical protein SGODD07_00682 [Streptococcus gordonii]